MSRETRDRTRPPGLGEFLFNELRQAFQDIRQKVVEEGWFGRVVSAAPVIEMDREPRSDPMPQQAEGLREQSGRSFDELWAPREPAKTARDVPSHEIEIDR